MWCISCFKICRVCNWAIFNRHKYNIYRTQDGFRFPVKVACLGVSMLFSHMVSRCIESNLDNMLHSDQNYTFSTGVRMLIWSLNLSLSKAKIQKICYKNAGGKLHRRRNYMDNPPPANSSRFDDHHKSLGVWAGWKIPRLGMGGNLLI